MEVKKSAITSLKPKKRLTAQGIVGRSVEMNQRMAESIVVTEKKIAIGMQRAQSIQAK